MTRRDIPNIISLLRILLVAPVIYLIGIGQYATALVLFLVAGVSDGIDGFLARHYNWRSRLGSILDPLADKLLLVSSYLVCGWLGLVPVWLVVAVILRDLIIVIGATLYHHWFEPFRGEPLLVSKLNTLFQLGLLVLVLLVNAKLWALPPAIITAAVYAVLVTTVWSGGLYVYLWGWRARKHLAEGTGRRAR